MSMAATMPASADAFQKSLMSLWLHHKAECRPISDIITDARAGELPGIEPVESGFGFVVVDEAAALAAMRGQ